MCKDKNFAKNLKLLRLAHSLSHACLAELLNFKSKGSISNIESGRSLPLFTAAEKIADLFAVSLDWLTGRTNEPYSNEVITSLENYLLDKAKRLGKAEDVDDLYEVNDADDNKALGYFRLAVNKPLIDKTSSPYKSEDTRKSRYSLPVRANMIFAMKIFYYTSLIFHKLNPLSKEDFNFPTINKVIVPKLKEEKNGTALWELNNRCLNMFQTYISLDPYDKSEAKIPVFDIKAYINAQ